MSDCERPGNKYASGGGGGGGEGVLLYISHIGFVLSQRVGAPFWSENGY